MNVELRRFEEAVVSHLGPYLGESMARAALVGHCRNLGIEADELAAEQVERLLLRLRQGMTLFVGADKAETLVSELRADVSVGVLA